MICCSRLGKNNIRRKMLHDLPGEVQRRVATFALEGGSREVRNGDRFLGSDRKVFHEQRRCKCGLCVSTDGPSTSSSCILVDGGLRAVRREKTTEICLVVCHSRYPLRMILKFIAGLLRAVVERMPEGVEDFVRISLQRDDGRPAADRPYVFVASIDPEDQLELAFFKGLEGDPDAVVQDYVPGSRIPAAAIARAEDIGVRLEREVMEGNGKAYSLVLVAPRLAPRDFHLASLRFRYEAPFAFRARPLYVFTAAHSEAPP